MKNSICSLLIAAVTLLTSHVRAAATVVYEGTVGPGLGKRIVFLAGDEEYRSEETLVQMARILAVRHGFTCTVLFSLDTNGMINPNAASNLTGAEALDHADVIFMMLRFRHWPDATMKHFVDAYLAGKPIIGLRTATHAFAYSKNSTYARYSHNSTEWPGGFGRQVLGETWVSHLGTNHKEATRGIIEPSAADNPLLRGVGQIFADTGEYHVNPQADSTILLRGEVLEGTTPDAPLNTTGKNNPLRPLAWSRIHRNEAGTTNRVFCTTMGSSTDLRDESLRRLLVNSVYWGLGMEVPAKADVRLVGDFQPTEYGPEKFRRGVKPDDLALPESPSRSAPAENASITYNFRGIPMGQFLDEYENLAGKKVAMKVTPNPGQLLRVITPRPLTKSEALTLCEEVLKEQAGLIIVHEKDGSLTAIAKP